MIGIEIEVTGVVKIQATQYKFIGMKLLTGAERVSATFMLYDAYNKVIGGEREYIIFPNPESEENNWLDISTKDYIELVSYCKSRLTEILNGATELTE